MINKIGTEQQNHSYHVSYMGRASIQSHQKKAMDKEINDGSKHIINVLNHMSKYSLCVSENKKLDKELNEIKIGSHNHLSDSLKQNTAASPSSTNNQHLVANDRDAKVESLNKSQEFVNEKEMKLSKPIIYNDKNNASSASMPKNSSDIESNMKFSSAGLSASTDRNGDNKKHEFYLIHHDISKKANIGTMIRSACAFGVKEILIVGRSRDMSTFGAKGAEGYVPMRFFSSIKDIKEFLVQNKILMCGVEIRDDSLSVSNSECFRGTTAFLMGNEGTGIHPLHAKLCDYFVYIPHFGNGTASLNVAVAFSIVCHRFATWANYKERPRIGEKFVVDESKKMEVRHALEGEKREDRKKKKEERESFQINLGFMNDEEENEEENENEME